MKRLLISTAILLFTLGACGGCNLLRRDRLEPEEVAASVYKIRTTLTVSGGDLAPGKTVKGSWTGTAWVAGVDHNRSTLVTAGHVCETNRTYSVEGFFGDSISYDVESVSYALMAPDGTSYEGLTVLLDDDDVDLCALSVPGWLGEPISIAHEDPPYGAEGYYVGAPHGIWDGGIAGYYQTHFSGRGTPWGDGKIALAFSTAQAMHGASGAPYVYDGRVVAVLTKADPTFPTYSTGVPHDVLRSFLARAAHRVED